jgi:hypothetical protein
MSSEANEILAAEAGAGGPKSGLPALLPHAGQLAGFVRADIS